MSRIKTTADYFPHDSDMRNDDRIRTLRTKFGLTGYAVWCMLLEKLSDSENLKIEHTPKNIDRIANDFNIKRDKLQPILDCMVEEELIVVNGYITCPKLQDRLSDLFNKREYWRNRKRSQRGEDECPTDVHMDSTCSHPLNKTKLNKTKLNNIKPDEYNIPEEDMDLVNELLDIFCEEYESKKGFKYHLIGNKGKDRKAVGMLLAYYRQESPESNTDDAMRDFRSLFRGCLNTSDKWLLDHISPMLIATRYNDFKSSSMEKNNGRESKLTDNDLAEVMLKHFGSGK